MIVVLECILKENFLVIAYSRLICFYVTLSITFLNSLVRSKEQLQVANKIALSSIKSLMGRMATVLHIIFIMRKDLDTMIIASSKPHHRYSPYASKSQKEDLYTISKLSAVFCVHVCICFIYGYFENERLVKIFSYFLYLGCVITIIHCLMFEHINFCALFTAWYWYSWWTCSWYHHSLASFMASHISNLHQRMYQWLCWILVSSFWVDDRRAMAEFIVM